MNPLRCACKTFSVSSAYTCSDKHHHHHHHQDLWPAFATLQWSPAAWLSCLSNVDGVMAFTTGEWQSWFCMYLGLPLPSMCALGANNRRCPCQRPYDVNGDHILTCCHHKATRTRCHNHILACLVSLFRQAGFHADSKGVPRIQRPQDKYYVADMFSRDMCVGTLRGVTVDVSTVHDFHGSADKPSLNGTLRHQDLDLALLRGARLASRLPACDRLHVWTHPWGVTPASLQPRRQKDLQLPRGPW